MVVLTAVYTFAFWSGYAGELPRHFTGIPSVDLFSAARRLPHERAARFDSNQVDVLNPALLNSIQTKSPWLAGAMSLALPGTGEFYSENYVKSGIFLAAEIAGWIVAYTLDKKGDRQTDLFQNYADAYWSVVKYAEWLNRFRSQNISIDSNTSLQPWERVDWNELNNAERTVASGQQGRGFTHTLPPHGEQQYYELIGKYHQYSTGWYDFDQNNPDFMQLSARFNEYSRMRGKANDYYNIASTAVSIVVVNHIISAIDAYFTAAGFNKSLHASARMHLRDTPFGPVAETVGTVSFSF